MSPSSRRLNTLNAQARAAEALAGGKGFPPRLTSAANRCALCTQAPPTSNSSRTTLTRNVHDTYFWHDFVQNGSIKFRPRGGGARSRAIPAAAKSRFPAIGRAISPRARLSLATRRGDAFPRSRLSQAAAKKILLRLLSRFGFLLRAQAQADVAAGRVLDHA